MQLENHCHAVTETCQVFVQERWARQVLARPVSCTKTPSLAPRPRLLHQDPKCDRFYAQFTSIIILNALSTPPKVGKVYSVTCSNFTEQIAVLTVKARTIQSDLEINNKPVRFLSGQKCHCFLPPGPCHVTFAKSFL